MLTIRPKNERGLTQTDWLTSFHTFSFNRYFDPRHMGFRDLRVINEDFVEGAGGFGTHPHHDMEILTWVMRGALAHKDSTGGAGVIGPGEIQRMTAGTGVTHSEFNDSETEEVHLLQIWIKPERKGFEPGYEQKLFEPDTLRDTLRLVAARDGRLGAVTIRQDADLYVARLGAGREVVHELKPGRHAWIQVSQGKATVNGVNLEAGDGASASDETTVTIAAETGAEVLVFDLR